MPSSYPNYGYGAPQMNSAYGHPAYGQSAYGQAAYGQYIPAP